jgi:crotonobetainyl-CoA:carnitine CoA-transferase CaiB-like acyl-CoA transferase
MPVSTSANTVECYSTTTSCFNIHMCSPQIGTPYQPNNPLLIMDRTQLDPKDVVALLWNHLGLPSSALASLSLPGSGLGAPSSFKLGILAQASIGLSALSAALVYGYLNDTSVPKVEVPLQHAVVEFNSSAFLTIDGKPLSSTRPPIGGLHKTADGHVRIHDGFLVHREALKKLLGRSGEDDRDQIAAAVAQWTTIEFETAALKAGLAVATLRSSEQWDSHPQARAISDFPITIRKISDSPPSSQSTNLKPGSDKCLRGLRVVEMTRVIAGPVAGKTLAAHGADVLCITSPNLEHQPSIDRDFARGKRTVCLDIDVSEDRVKLDGLLEEADVFLQSYRPGSLASKGLSPEDIAAKSKKGIVCANLSAYGPTGPWSKRRGFDSLVQTCSGMNVSEAEHFGAGETARPLPFQALDHASGYFLAAGIAAVLYRQAIEGGSYAVDVSLAGTMKFLRSLGQYEGSSGFDAPRIERQGDVPVETLEERESGFGRIRAVKHSAVIEGVDVEWDVMPRPLGSDRAEWIR